MGVWTKVKDHWVYDGEMNRLIRLDKGTSYEQLIEKICVATETNKDEFDISLTLWNCFPNKQVQPPSTIRNNGDVTIVCAAWKFRCTCQKC